MSTQIVIRLESELKDKVDRLARKEGKVNEYRRPWIDRRVCMGSRHERLHRQPMGGDR